MTALCSNEQTQYSRHQAKKQASIMFSLSGVFSLGSNSSAKQTKQALLKVLQDDSLQMLSSLELNQWATLTFQDNSNRARAQAQVQHHTTAAAAADIGKDDDLCECLFATLRDVMSQPLAYSPIAIHKALAVAKHMLLLGATRVMNEGRVLLPAVTALLNYNTALLAQQQTGATGFLLRLKGGTQDQGGPIRDEATVLHRLLTDPALLQRERAAAAAAAAAADPNDTTATLVPVGNKQQIVFCTDEMRLQVLQRTIQQQQQLKSNLVAQVSRDGFGGGYVSKDGKSVVGAAHSLEEMMQHAARQENKFTDDDDGDQHNQNHHGSGGGAVAFAEYVAPTLIQQQQLAFATPPRPSLYPESDLLGTISSTSNTAFDTATGDLLSMSPPNNHHEVGQQQQADLLGFDQATAATTSQALPLQQHSTAENHDLLSLSNNSTTNSSNNIMKSTSSSFYSGAMNVGGATNNDPFANLSATSSSSQPPPPPPQQQQSPSMLIGSRTSQTTTMTTTMGNHRMNAFDSLNPLAAGGSSSSSSSTYGGARVSGSNNKPTLSAMSAFRTNVNDVGVSMMGGMSMNKSNHIENDDNAFVMGGDVGSGLDPIGRAPAAPPPSPPPPPSSSAYTG